MAGTTEVRGVATSRGSTRGGRHRIGGLLRAGLVVFVLSNPTSALAAYPGQNGRIAYSSGGDRGVEAGIKVIDPVTRAVQTLTSGPTGADGVPSFSPDGSQIAFWTNRGVTSTPEIARMNADGSGRVRVAGSALDNQPVWSPDGSTLAYTTLNPTQISLVRLPSGTPTPFRSDVRGALEPAWSPDGTRIAFRGTHEGAQAIYVAPADGSGGPPRRITSQDAGERQPNWSPDGSRIAYAARAGGGSQIFVVSVDGTGQPRQITQGGQGSFDPAWSPDGRQIAFQRSSDVFVASVDGSVPAVNLTSSPESDRQPDWQPVGVARPPDPAQPIGSATVGPGLLPGTPAPPPSSAPPTGRAPTGPAAAARPRRLQSGIRSVWSATRRGTTLVRLVVTNVPAGAMIEVRCKGRSCPFTRRTRAVRRAGAVSLQRLLRGRRLRRGVLLEVRVLKRGFIGKVVRFRVQGGRRIPTDRSLCLSPNARRPSRC